MHSFNLKAFVRHGLAAILTSLLLLSTVHSVWAITRGYNSDDTLLKAGMVVSLSQSNSTENPKVERATRDQLERVIGVATTVDESLVTISSGNQTVYVSGEGEVDAFVTDLDGEIRQGDMLTLSPLRGVLTKAFPGQPAIALAAEDFSIEQAETHTITEVNADRSIRIQKLRVNLDRQAIADLQPGNESVLSNIGKSLVGRDVEELQVIIAMIIFFIVLVAEGTILYGAISSAINSLGRNPLAKNIIKRELIRVVFIAMTVLIIGLAAIYAVLLV